MKKSDEKAVKHEASVMEKINHVNVIKTAWSGSAMFIPTNDEPEMWHYIALELGLDHDLFDFVSEGAKFSENFSAHLFKQMIEGLIAINEAGYSHLDIKL